MKFLDIKNVKGYSPKGLSDEVLGDDLRLILALYCQKKNKKKVKATYEGILNVARLIIQEISKRGKRKFHPKRMQECSREAFMKAISKDFPKGIKVPISDMDYDGLFLPKPHSELIVKGKKKYILLSSRNRFEDPLYFMDEDFIFGYVLLSKPKKVSLDAAMRRQKEHFVTKQEVKKFGWSDKDLYISRYFQLLFSKR